MGTFRFAVEDGGDPSIRISFQNVVNEGISGAIAGKSLQQGTPRPDMSKSAHLTFLACVVMASPMSAHVLLEGKQAPVGADYKAVFIVPHGCSGSPTTKLRVQIPEGVIATEAKPVDGWNVETVKGKYSVEYDYKGAKISEGIKEVAWSGGKLPDKTRQQFVIETYLAGTLTPSTTLYFRVVQECERGVARWIEIPADGATHPHEGKWPAPGLKLTKP
jgi:periplasmic copper chaperone A